MCCVMECGDAPLPQRCRKSSSPTLPEYGIGWLTTATFRNSDPKAWNLVNVSMIVLRLDHDPMMAVPETYLS
jgi:hypothetical protein